MLNFRNTQRDSCVFLFSLNLVADELPLLVNCWWQLFAVLTQSEQNIRKLSVYDDKIEDDHS